MNLLKLLWIATALVPLAAQSTAVDVPAKPAEVWLVGASLTHGFVDPVPLPDGERNSSVPLARAIAKLWGDAEPRVVDRSDAMTFLDPTARQEVALRRIADAPPGLVLGIDFPFWFGYGHLAGTGDEVERRVALQRRGLALLEALDVPIVLGDYPDMTGAAVRMLSPRQIPSVAARERLNAELRGWAAERDNVTVFPLSEFVGRLKSDGIAIRYGHSDLTLTGRELLQGDRLHPTRLGMALLATHLADHLRERFAAGHPLRPAERSFERLVVDAGADLAIEWVLEEHGDREAASATPEAGDGDGRGKRRP